MTPSKYQQDIYDWVDAEGNASVNAVAGSGKTTTLVQLAPLLGRGAQFCAFNKKIALELEQRLPPNVAVKTIHGMGHSALKNVFKGIDVTEGRKYRDLCKKAAKDWQTWNPTLPISRAEIQSAIASIVGMSMRTLTNLKSYKAVDRMCLKYDISIHPTVKKEELYILAGDVLKEGMRLLEEKRMVDYDDMIYYPFAKKLNIWKNKWLLVDEAQDLSAAQLEMVRSALFDNGRLIAVGDPCQSIYGFTGADPWSFSRIQEEFGTIDLPLSVCYRCPKEIVRMAQKLVPQIEWADNAEEGIINTAGDVLEAASGDMVICRTNAPLFSAYSKFLKAGRPAYIEGKKESVGMFITIVKRVEKRNDYTNWQDFPACLKAYEKELIEMMQEAGEDISKILKEHDKFDVIRACYTLFPHCRNSTDLENEMKRMFQPSDESVVLSTIHRAKGLEKDNIFVLDPGRIRISWPTQKNWQAYQEQCCEYVMLTRARKSLNFIGAYKVGPRIILETEDDNEGSPRTVGAGAVNSVGDDPFFD